MTKRAVLCPWQSDQESGSNISDGLETTSDYLTSSSLYVLLWGWCSRDLSTIPGLSTTRAIEITISYADLPLSGRIYRHPLDFLFSVRRLIAAPFSLLSYPCTCPCLNTWRVSQESHSTGKENPYKSLYVGPGNMNHSHDLVKRALHSFPLLSLRWHGNILLARRIGNPGTLFQRI